MASDLIKSGWNGWQKEATLATLVVRARFFPAAASHASIRGGSVFERETAGCWLLAIILCLVETRNPKKKKPDFYHLANCRTSRHSRLILMALLQYLSEL